MWSIGRKPRKPTTQPKSSGACFDRLARHYYWMEVLLAGRTLQRCRTAFLDRTRAAKSALLLGEGNGQFLPEFLDVNQTASVLCVDSSARMLALTRERVGAADEGRVRFVHADVLAMLASKHRALANSDTAFPLAPPVPR